MGIQPKRGINKRKNRLEANRGILQQKRTHLQNIRTRLQLAAQRKIMKSYPEVNKTIQIGIQQRRGIWKVHNKQYTTTLGRFITATPRPPGWMVACLGLGKGLGPFLAQGLGHGPGTGGGRSGTGVVGAIADLRLGRGSGRSDCRFKVWGAGVAG